MKCRFIFHRIHFKLHIRRHASRPAFTPQRNWAPFTSYTDGSSGGKVCQPHATISSRGAKAARFRLGVITGAGQANEHLCCRGDAICVRLSFFFVWDLFNYIFAIVYRRYPTFGFGFWWWLVGWVAETEIMIITLSAKPDFV